MNSTDKALLKAQIYMNLGIAVKNTGDPDKAIEFINFSLTEYIKAGNLSVFTK